MHMVLLYLAITATGFYLFLIKNMLYYVKYYIIKIVKILKFVFLHYSDTYYFTLKVELFCSIKMYKWIKWLKNFN